jgi:ATP-binding cassette subfamily C protein CydC
MSRADPPRRTPEGGAPGPPPAPTPPVDAAALLAQAVAARRGRLRAAIAASILAALAGSVLLALSGWFLAGAGLAGLAGTAAALAFNYLVPSAFIRLSAVVRTAARYGERLWSHEAALHALADIRPRLFARLATADPRRSRPLLAGQAAARLTADVDALEDRVIRLPATPAAVMAAVVATLLAAWAAWPAGLLAGAGLVAVLPLADRLARRLADPHVAGARRLEGQLRAEAAELAAAGPELAASGLSGRAAAALAEAAVLLDATRRRAARGAALVAGLPPALGALLAAGIVLLAAGQASAPLLAAAVLGVMAAADALGAPVRARLDAPRSAEGLARLAALEDPAAAAAPGAAAPVAAPVAGDERLVIAGHVLQPGGRLALVGRSGSGKTRLIETLAGLRDDAPEPLAVAGADPRRLPVAELAARFALAPQDPALFAGTVADNLRLARPGLDEAELWAALETACLAEEVHALPHELQTWLGDGARRLSGGQRKRLALARALLAARPWLLLDEPSEGLDAATEGRLAQSLDAWAARTGTGLVIASHRPALAALAGNRRLALPLTGQGQGDAIG